MMPDKELRDIEAFVNGTLPQDRYAAFVSQLQSNPDLKEKVRLYRMMQVGLLQLRFQHRINSKRRTRLLPFTAKQVGYMAAAAVILIIGSLFLIPSLMRSSTDELFDTFYAAETRSRGENEQTAALIEAKEDYFYGRYESALEKLNKVPDDSLRTRVYFRGLTYLALEQPLKAITDLKNALLTTDTLLRPRIEWYLALAYLKAGNIDESRQYLGVIKSNPKHPFREQSLKLLPQLP